MINTKEIFDTTNKTKLMHYPLDKIFYAQVDQHKSIVCEIIIAHKPRYVEIMIIPDFVYTNRVLTNNFKIEKSLKEEINIKNVNVCLISKDGKEKREITVDEIINIIKLINLLDKKSFDGLNQMCMSMANQISDLLGINVYSNPSSFLQINDIEEIIVPASKAIKFRNLLFNYIKISIILDESVSITNTDYRIIRALNGCKIKTPEFENEFLITGNSNGEVSLECNYVTPDFQKPYTNNKFRNKKA